MKKLEKEAAKLAKEEARVAKEEVAKLQRLKEVEEADQNAPSTQ